MFTVYRYYRGIPRARTWVAEFKRADLACTYAETLAQSASRTVARHWADAVAQGKRYVPDPVTAYAVTGLPTGLGHYPVTHPDPGHVHHHNAHHHITSAAA